MDAPRIQYARTEDGVSIAFSAYGQGPAVLWLGNHPFAGSIQTYWRLEWFQAVASALAPDHTVITYDPRGTGLSRREPGWLTLESQRLELDAVLDKLDVGSADIFSFGPYDIRVAIDYALYTSRQVERLVLVDGAPRDADFSPAEAQILQEILRRDWTLFTETTALLAFGWSGDDARRYAGLVRDSIDSPTARKYLAFYASQDISGRLPDIRASTLIIQHKEQRLVGRETGQSMAAVIPGAEFLWLEGSMGEHSDEFAAVVSGFLIREAPGAAAETEASSTFRTILFTDLSDHTAMMQRLGDARGREVLREHERLTRETLAGHGGTEVKALGDGFLASFGSTQGALECAIALQQRFRDAGPLGGVEAVSLHIGINAGEPIEEDDDLFGSSVILAARAAGKAKPGQILVTNVVRELVAGKGFLFGDTGEFEL